MGRNLIIAGGGAGGDAAAEEKRRDPGFNVTIEERGEFVSYASSPIPYYYIGDV